MAFEALKYTKGVVIVHGKSSIQISGLREFMRDQSVKYVGICGILFRLDF